MRPNDFVVPDTLVMPDTLVIPDTLVMPNAFVRLNVSMMRAQSRSFRASIMSSRLTSRSTTAIDTRVVHIVTTVASA